MFSFFIIRVTPSIEKNQVYDELNLFAYTFEFAKSPRLKVFTHIEKGELTEYCTNQLLLQSLQQEKTYSFICFRKLTILGKNNLYKKL